ncbi:MAG: helicase-related protein [Candidatus Thorarchaeota archaeon]
MKKWYLQIMLVNELYQYVLQMLNGSHESCERIHLFQKPSKQFIIGSLADSSKDYTAGESIGEAKTQTKSALRHNSLSIFFLIGRDVKGTVMVKPSCSLFYKVFPTYDEQKEYIEKVNREAMFESVRSDPGFKQYYMRLNCDFKPIELELEQNFFPLDFSDYISSIEGDEHLYRTNSVINKDLKEKGIKNNFDPSWIIDEQSYISVLNEIKKTERKKGFNWEANIEIEREQFDDTYDLITVRFINITKGKGVEKFEKFLFNANLNIDLGMISIFPFHYTFKYEGFNYEEFEYLRTLNCHADYSKDTNNITTKAYATYNQEKRVPRTEINGAITKFKDLKSSLDPLNLILEELKKQYNKYINHSIFQDENEQHHLQFRQDTRNFSYIVERFEKGLEILKTNENAKKSFFYMNEVFEEAAANLYEEWRLFQIVYIVMAIPDIVDINNNREKVDIIHVTTGGGKSETYFGLTIFLLFWDRLRGKTQGVSAISKFPLRMLSIQQLQRIAKIVTLAEELRKTYQIEGSPFSVGYYVGVSEAFPRYTYDKIREIKNATDKKEEIEGVLLDTCPKCQGNIYLDVEKDAHRIAHKCAKCQRKYYLYFTNSEIYRFIPSIIISTVDKLASVALNRRFKNLLGGKLSICSKGHGFAPRNDSCEARLGLHKSCEAETIVYDQEIEGPTLMIQDEMHLLREGFGTINSHFESLLNVLLQKFSDKQFKYIGMTATVSGAKGQIDHLYGKDYFIFPGNVPRGFNEEEDFFFEYIKDDYNNRVIQRILIGLKPNLRDNQYASLLTIFHIANFIQKVKDNKEKYRKEHNLALEFLEKELEKYQCLLTYHGKKADVFGMNYFLHTVVTSKLDSFEIIGKPLTGDNSLEEIKKAIATIQEFPQKFSKENKLHSTFATSVVSHGVDINNWNIMIFQGITRDTSEYIQALSRVGRKFTGLIFLWFYPNRVRDLSYYKNFNLYHRILQLKVEKTPISRWTKLGFKQTITSIFSAAILNYMSNLHETPIYKVEDVNLLFDEPDNRKNLIEFIQKAYYTHMKRVGVDWLRKNIGDEVEKRLNYLKKYSGSIYKNFFPNALRDSMDKYYKTQYGMRGIQEQITLKLNENYANFIHKFQKKEN